MAYQGKAFWNKKSISSRETSTQESFWHGGGYRRACTIGYPPRQSGGLPQAFQISSGSPLHDFLRNTGSDCSATVLTGNDHDRGPAGTWKSDRKKTTKNDPIGPKVSPRASEMDPKWSSGTFPGRFGDRSGPKMADMRSDPLFTM